MIVIPDAYKCVFRVNSWAVNSCLEKQMRMTGSKRDAQISCGEQWVEMHFNRVRERRAAKNCHRAYITIPSVWTWLQISTLNQHGAIWAKMSAHKSEVSYEKRSGIMCLQMPVDIFGILLSNASVLFGTSIFRVLISAVLYILRRMNELHKC